MALKNLKDKLTSALDGGASKYTTSLLGESLSDLIRKATARTLEFPDEEANQQVVYAINTDGQASGKEAVTLLNKRLQQDNYQKQFLAVVLVAKVLQECTSVVGAYQEEMLREVASVMTRPSRRDNIPASRAKAAAKELLKMYGTSGTDAFRQAARSSYYPQGYSTAGGLDATPNYSSPPHGTGVSPPLYGPQGQMLNPPEAASRAAERESIMDEIRRMTLQGKGHSELLNEMLVTQADGPMDDFDQDLIRELLTDVKQLRDMFNVYLEQLGAMEGPDAEELMCAALEAVDQLDNALAMDKEITATRVEDKGKGPATAATAAAAAAAVAAAVRPPSSARNLIDLDDLSEALPPATAGGAGPSGSGGGSAVEPRDPFAQLDPDWAPAATTAAPAAAAAAAVQPQQHQQPGYGGVSQLTAASPFLQAGMATAGPPPAAYPQPPLQQQQQPGGYVQQQQQHGGYPQAQQQLGAYPQQQLQQQRPPQQQQQQQAYPPPGMYPGAVNTYPASPGYTTGGPPAPQPPYRGSPAHAGGAHGGAPNPFSPHAPSSPYADSPTHGNPFATAPSAGAKVGSPAYGRSSSLASNPFSPAAPRPQQQQQQHVDAEWNQYFGAPASGPSPAAAARPVPPPDDFDALVSRR